MLTLAIRFSAKLPHVLTCFNCLNAAIQLYDKTAELARLKGVGLSDPVTSLTYLVVYVAIANGICTVSGNNSII